MGAGQGAESVCRVSPNGLDLSPWQKDGIIDQQGNAHLSSGLTIVVSLTLVQCPSKDPGHRRADHLLLLFLYTLQNTLRLEFGFSPTAALLRPGHGDKGGHETARVIAEGPDSSHPAKGFIA